MPRAHPLALLLASALPLSSFASSAQADTGYAFSIDQPTSTLTYTFSASAPFGSGGTPAVASTLIGTNDPMAAPTEQTRTRHMQSLFTCGTFTTTQNELITISGAIAASGSSSSGSPIHPGGTFKLGLNTAAGGGGIARLQDLNLNLIASGSISASASLNNFTYESFCTINPACNAPFLFSVPLPLGTISVTSLLAQQAAGVPSTGTLTSVDGAANKWDFSVDAPVTVTPTITFAGAPLTASPQQLTITFAGRVTILTPTTASIMASTQLTYAPPADAPGPQAPTAFAVPTDSQLCPGINIILTMNILSSTVNSANTASLSAPGTKFPCPCDTNHNGGVEIQDIFDFLNLWFAGNPAADFNHTAGITTQDIFDFLNCWFTAPVGC